jgi:peptide methionine sulfoxide reductase msrA/msrB
MSTKNGFVAKELVAVALAFGAVVYGGPRKRSSVRQQEPAAPTETVLIDDFSSKTLNSVFRPAWTLVTDQVTGGLSTGAVEITRRDGRPCLHMTANVSLKNNGGFVKARTNLAPKGSSFDAKNFKGIYLQAKAKAGLYAIHLRTGRTRLPGQYYQAEFQTDGTWQDIRIGFDNFKPSSRGGPVDTRNLKSIAVVAIKDKFEADIYIDKIGFYKEQGMYKKLTPAEERVIIHKGTERPFSGKFNNHYEEGAYTCKQCGTELFDSSSKFKSQCGWPSFDDQVKGAVKLQRDADRVRTEITCDRCGGHLGHVFMGEDYTPKNTRYCVNSISLDFDPAKVVQTETAIFASGCFWGTQYHFQKAPGVISTKVGYTGGHIDNPSYRQVCTDRTGHAEAVEVVYDPSKITYEQLAKLFFETHDFTQLNRQGPDVGSQYRSTIFVFNEQQKKTATKLVEVLRQKGYDVKTTIAPAARFWPGEQYHQDYYDKTGKTPYCHIYRKIF